MTDYLREKLISIDIIQYISEYIMTEQLLADNPNLTKEYVCDYSPDLKLALNNTHYWIITIKGKDTFKYREIIKKKDLYE